MGAAVSAATVACAAVVTLGVLDRVVCVCVQPEPECRAAPELETQPESETERQMET